MKHNGNDRINVLDFFFIQALLTKTACHVIFYWDIDKCEYLKVLKKFSDRC